MGLIHSLKGRRVYLDTNVLIYWIEGTPVFKKQISSLKNAFENEEFTACVSHIIFAEILPPLVKNNDETALVSTIEFLRDSGLFSLIPAGEDVCIQTGILRGQLGMKTPDAIHVASALHAKCDVFLTNDMGIRVPNSMKRVLLSDL